MRKLKNTTLETIDLRISGEPKDGVPPTDHIAPGETKDIDAIDNLVVEAHLSAGSLVEEGGARAPRKAAPKE